MLSGHVVLLYLKYQNRSGQYYPRRGGNSGNGSACGAFYVNLDIIASYGSWAYGAALVYQSRSGAYYPVRGGQSGYGSDCGEFCVSLAADTFIGYWYYGAALSYKPSA